MLVHFSRTNKSWPAVPDEALVLWDAIQERWGKNKKFTIPAAQEAHYINSSNTSRLLHRWIVTDSLVSARAYSKGSRMERELDAAIVGWTQTGADMPLNLVARCTRAFNDALVAHGHVRVPDVPSEINSLSMLLTVEQLTHRFFATQLAFSYVTPSESTLIQRRLLLLRALEPWLPDPNALIAILTR